MFRYLGSMLYNGEELLLARKIYADKKRDELAEKEQKKQSKEDEMMERAEAAYEKHVEGQKLNVNDLKAVVRFACALEGKADKKNSSQYKTKKLLLWCWRPFQWT